MNDDDDIAEDLEAAFYRLMTEDIGNESSMTFRNAINSDVAKHLAHQLTRITVEIIKEHNGL